MHGEDRIDYLLRKSAGSAIIWTLSRNGDAIRDFSLGKKVCPIWSELAFARVCVSADRWNWADTVPLMVCAYEFLDEWVPEMLVQSESVMVFPTVDDPGGLVDPREFETWLRAEMIQYE